MRYLAAIYTEDSAGDAAATEQGRRMLDAYRIFGEEARAAGVMLDGEGLQPAATATTVRVRDGETMLTDGPFAETREQLGGYYLLECRDLDEAIRWAATIPDAANGSVEVRPVMDYEAMGAEAPNHDAAARG